MCGRATLTVSAEEIAEIFDVEALDIGPPRFNIAPTQPLVTVRADDDPSSPRRLAVVRWGLVPWWAKAEEAKKIGARCIQARAETAATAPAYREPFKRQRCLAIVDGFYEWRTLPDGRRAPFHVHQASRAPFAIAALWDRWKTDGTIAANAGDGLESAAVLTTRARGALASIHDRMPLVLPAAEWDRWLRGAPDDARPLLRRGGIADELVAAPVSTWVNDVKHDDPTCVAPVDAA